MVGLYGIHWSDRSGTGQKKRWFGGCESLGELALGKILVDRLRLRIKSLNEFLSHNNLTVMKGSKYSLFLPKNRH